VADDVRVSLELRIGRLDSPEGATLAAAHLAEMERRYDAPDEWDGLEPDQLAPPHGTFVIAWLDGDPVACGGLRRIDAATSEIKRMYVTDDVRRRGIARAVLGTLEHTALDLGYARLILETGTLQPEAIALYLADGYEPIEPYGVYRDSPLSRCFAKTLDA
jgi:GNAT superfamily N-acetyltransferase